MSYDDPKMQRLTAFEFNDSEINSLRAQYLAAKPFPHIVLDNVLRVSPLSITKAFPDLSWSGWQVQRDTYQLEKRYCRDIEAIPGLLRDLITELAAPRFLSLVSEITGVEDLLPDPYLEGGGLHCSGPGGKLAPHTDFHVYGRLKLFRQINVLLYLNPSWSDADGGQLELFQKSDSSPVKRISPQFARCIMFQTNHRSIHGVHPIRAGAPPRQSIAMYYYTSQESREFMGDGITYWQGHDRQGLGPLQRVELGISRGVTFAARGLAALGHRVNPIFRAAEAKEGYGGQQ